MTSFGIARQPKHVPLGMWLQLNMVEIEDQNSNTGVNYEKTQKNWMVLESTKILPPLSTRVVKYPIGLNNNVEKLLVSSLLLTKIINLFYSLI